MDQVIHIDVNSGLLIGSGVQYIPSPNYDERPPHTGIDLLVIHNISLPRGVFDTEAITALFCNKLKVDTQPEFATLLANVKVSAHLLICRNGTIIQYVPFTKRAWHAGVSQFQGRKNCNDFSIGIELEGTDDTPYEDIQYQQLALVTSLLLQTYPEIILKRIVGHSDIAPQRKTDPGPAFLWKKYRSMLIIRHRL